MAAGLLLLEPDVLAGGILFRATLPLVPEPLPALAGRRVLLCAGERDSLVPRQGTEELAAILGKAGAEVTVTWEAAGHELTPGDVAQARGWLARAA
jgi:predicted esterase